MEKPRFMQAGDVFVVLFRTKDYEGIVPFKIDFSQARPFQFGQISSSISPGSYTRVRLGGTFLGSSIDDLLYFTRKGVLLHIWLDTHPKVRIYPEWPSGTLQGDFNYTEGKLPAEVGEDWGWIVPPVEFIVIPKIHLDFDMYNPYGTETVQPLVKFWWAEYNVKLVRDVDMILAILQRRFKPKWFVAYGAKPFVYEFSETLGIAHPIPLDADVKLIEEIVRGWPEAWA